MKKSPSPRADTWDSYRDTLVALLEYFRPENILEFGIGKSTKYFLQNKDVKILDTVEHSPVWASKFKYLLQDARFKIILESNETYYPYAAGRLGNYDLVFVDGIKREQCLMNAHHLIEDGGIVVLHDAERVEYAQAILQFKYVVFRDDHHTAILTNSHNVYAQLNLALESVA